MKLSLYVKLLFATLAVFTVLSLASCDNASAPSETTQSESREEYVTLADEQIADGYLTASDLPTDTRYLRLKSLESNGETGQ